MEKTYSMEEQPYPRFSLAERDRRWKAVRSLMEEQGLAAIVVPNNTSHSTDFQANARYLSHCGGGGDAEVAVVFPLAGDVTVSVNSAGRWNGLQDWVEDVRSSGRSTGNAVVDRLHELKVENKRVGITGLGSGTRTPEGTILYQFMRRLQEEFSSTEFLDATNILDRVRYEKSAEEVAFLEKSVELIDEAFQVELREARVGVPDYYVWAKTIGSMLEGGSELPVHCNWVASPYPVIALTRPSHRLLQRGDIILNEVEASWAGYRAQGVQPICVETCDEMFLDLLEIQGAIFEQMLPMLKPGITVGELAEACKQICEKERPSTGKLASTKANLVMHGRGQGDDGPIITPQIRNPYQLAQQLRERMVFIFKPHVSCGDKHTIAWGDTVEITLEGGRRFGTRNHGMWITS